MSPMHTGNEAFYEVMMAVSGGEKQQPICKRKSMKPNDVSVARLQSWGLTDKRILELTNKVSFNISFTIYTHLYVCTHTHTQRGGQKIRRQPNWRRKASAWRALQTDRGRGWYQEHEPLAGRGRTEGQHRGTNHGCRRAGTQNQINTGRGLHHTAPHRCRLCSDALKQSSTWQTRDRRSYDACMYLTRGML